MDGIPHQFPVVEHEIYLNHAGVAPWPRCAAMAASAFAEENMLHGAAMYPKWLEAEAQLRENAARLINAPSADDIAFVKNTSEGLSIVAHGLTWKDGDNVVGIHQEFPSNRVVWESLADYGVAFRTLDLARSTDPESDLLSLCDAHTRVMAVSAVQFADGFRLNLEQLGEACRARGILFCVDAIQQIGALPFDAQAIEADFVIADGHKWMLGPEGLGLFYSHPDAREQLTLRQFGWHMRERPGDYEPDSPWKISGTATRFECGSPNMLGIHALNASIGLLLNEGMEKVGKTILERTRFIADWAESRPDIRLLSPISPDRQSGISTLRHRKLPPESLQRHLADNHVVCAVRGGGVRFSPHFYIPLTQLEEACDLLEQATRAA